MPPELQRLPVLVLDTSLVLFDALQNTLLFEACEEFGQSWTVGQQNEDHDSPGNRDCTLYDEDIAPIGQEGIDVSYSEACDTGDDVPKAGAADPDADAKWLLDAFIPHREDDHRDWLDSSLDHSQKEPTNTRLLAILDKYAAVS